MKKIATAFSNIFSSIAVALLICIFLGAAYLEQKNIVFFSSINTLPPAVAGEINLQCKRYIWVGIAPEYTTNSIVFPADCDSAIVGVNITTAPLVYLGTGTFLKGANFSSVRIENIALAAPTGKLFDFDGLGAFSDPGSLMKFDDVVIKNVADLGTVKDTTLRMNFSEMRDYGQGLISDSNRLSIERLPFTAPKDVTKNTTCTFDNVGNTVDAPAHNMFDNDLVRLTTDGTLPTGLYGEITLSSVADNGGKARFTTGANHNLTAGNPIFIYGTTNYDGWNDVVATPTATTFDVDTAYVAETLSGAEVQHVYYIVNKTTDDFQLSKTEGGAAVTFTDNGTGNHQFFENSIGLTCRGAISTIDIETVAFSLQNASNTAFDLEPVTFGTFPFGEARGVSFDTPEYRNNFTGSSLNQKYKDYRFVGTLNGFDSERTGVIYITGNTTATTITNANTIYEVTQGTPLTYNLERASQSGNRLCYDDDAPSLVTAQAFATMRKTGVAQAIVLHILKNGEDATVAEPVVDVAARNVTLSDVEEIEMSNGDCLSIGIENIDGTDNIIVDTYKLLWR